MQESKTFVCGCDYEMGVVKPNKECTKYENERYFERKDCGRGTFTLPQSICENCEETIDTWRDHIPLVYESTCMHNPTSVIITLEDSLTHTGKVYTYQ
jgi:hypothetical protein